jgi:hypothetical protein
MSQVVAQQVVMIGFLEIFTYRLTGNTDLHSQFYSWGVEARWSLGDFNIHCFKLKV